MKRVLFVFLAVVWVGTLYLAIRGHYAGNGPISSSAATRPAATKQLWTCLMHPQIVQDHPGLCPICKMPLSPMRPQGELLHDANEKSDGPPVTIDPSVVQNMGVRTAEVTRAPLIKTIRTVGVLMVAESAAVDISPRVNGWVQKLYANHEGMYVHKGDALFDLYSPELQVAAQELVGATAALKSLDPNSPEEAKANARDLVNSARRKLELWGVADTDVDAIQNSGRVPQTIPLRSPVDGEVEDKMIVEGSAIQSGMKAMRIEDHGRLWIEAQVYEGQLPMVALGQKMQAQFDYLPTPLIGTIDFINPHLDPTTRTVTARATIHNSNPQLKPEMYATVTITTDPIYDALQVPREAVIDTGSRQFVFVVASTGHFDPRNVHMGLTGDDGKVQILDGLKEGETVVTSGQFLLDVSSRTTEALEKISNDTQGR